jgi:hypothetical protein
MGKWHNNTYLIYGNIWAFLCMSGRSFGLHGIFSVPLPIFLDPESVRMLVSVFLY